MKIALLSDIHANQEALEDALLDAERQGVQRFWFLGDALGYGPDPQAPLLWLKYYVDANDWILGNHDAMYAGLMPLDGISPTARNALEMTRQRLSEPDNQEATEFCRQEFIAQRTQPQLHSLDGVDYMLVHSSQVDPLGSIRYVYAWHEDLFLPDEFAKIHLLSLASGRPCVQIFGHTHVPTLVYGTPTNDGYAFQAARILPGEKYNLGGSLALVNPGSVGFPRDMNNRLSYAILDTRENTVTFRRVEYNWYQTAAKITDYNFPDGLRDRLRFADPDNTTPQEWRKHYQTARETA